MAPAIAANEEADRQADAAWRHLFTLRPRTPAGFLALLNHIARWRDEYDVIHDAPDIFGVLITAFEGLRAADHLSEVQDGDKPASIEFMAGLDFPAYQFDAPQRDERGWKDALAACSFGLIVAESLLRKTKPETVEFVREAGEGDVVESIAKALGETHERLEGWSKIANLALMRMVSAGSVLAVEQDLANPAEAAA